MQSGRRRALGVRGWPGRPVGVDRHRWPRRRAGVHRRPVRGSEGVAAGLWIIEAADLDVALRLMTAGSKACNRRLEVRPMLPPPE